MNTKRLLAMLLTLCMVFSLAVPGVAFAEDEETALLVEEGTPAETLDETPIIEEQPEETTQTPVVEEIIEENGQPAESVIEEPEQPAGNPDEQQTPEQPDENGQPALASLEAQEVTMLGMGGGALPSLKARDEAQLSDPESVIGGTQYTAAQLYSMSAAEVTNNLDISKMTPAQVVSVIDAFITGGESVAETTLEAKIKALGVENGLMEDALLGRQLAVLLPDGTSKGWWLYFTQNDDDYVYTSVALGPMDYTPGTFWDAATNRWYEYTAQVMYADNTTSSHGSIANALLVAGENDTLVLTRNGSSDGRKIVIYDPAYTNNTHNAVVEVEGGVKGNLKVVGNNNAVILNSMPGGTIAFEGSNNTVTVVGVSTYATDVQGNTYPVISTDVAEIVGGNSYATLAEAIADAKNGDIVKLLDNVSIDYTSTISVGEKTITLDADGHTVTVDTTGGTRGIRVNGGSLTISGNGNFVGINSDTGNNSSIVDLSAGKLIIESGSFRNANTIIGVTSGTATIYNANMTALDGGCSVLAMGSNAVVNVYGLNFTCESKKQDGPGCVWAQDGGIVNIYGGTFNAGILGEASIPGETTGANYCLYDYRDAVAYGYQRGYINVYGGSFLAFNPQSNYNQDSFVAPGYAAVEKENKMWQVVQSVTEGEVTITVEQTANVKTDDLKDVNTETANNIQNRTSVSGVELTTTAAEGETSSGVAAVVAAAKQVGEGVTAKDSAGQAIEASAVATAVDDASSIEVKVTVNVVPESYDNASVQKTAVFQLTPVATITTKGSSNNTTAVIEGVKVENSMLDQTKDITVNIYTGFKPEIIVHRNDNGAIIETFTGNAISYNATTGVATVKIHHFSILEAVSDAAVASFIDDAGATRYATTLAEAIADAKAGTTVTLLADVELAEPITVDKKVTLGLAGKDITTSGVRAFILTSGADMTVVDLTATGSIEATGDDAFYLNNQDATKEKADAVILTITDGVTVSSTTDCAVFFRGSVTLNTIGILSSGGNYAAIQGNGSDTYATTAVNVGGGSVTGTHSSAIYFPNPGTLNIAGGTVTGYESGIAIKSGTLNVTGGTIHCTGPDTTPTTGWSNGVNASGAAIQVESNSDYGTVNVNISGTPTITSDNGVAVYEYIGAGSATQLQSLAVTGGEFNGGTGKQALMLSEQAATAKAAAVSGGSFSSVVPAAYCAAGFSPVTEANADGKYTVEETKVAKIGDNEYTSLADAIAAVPADGTKTTITMIADEAINVTGYALTIPTNKNVVLDLNGYEVVGLCAESGTSALIRNLGTLTIQDSSDTNADGSGNGKLIGGASPTWIWDGSDNYTGSYASNLIRNEGTLTVNSGYLMNVAIGSAAYAIDNYGSGKVTINGGTIDAAKASAIRLFYNNGGSVKVTGGEIGHYTDDNDRSYMGIQGMSGTKADIIISGGTIDGYYSVYTNATGTSEVSITGGTFPGSVEFGSDGPNTISISGGKFKDWVGAYGDQTAFITGGTYSGNPSTYSDDPKTSSDESGTYIADGYAVLDNDDPATKDDYPFKVGIAPAAVAEIGETKYPTLAAAIAAAQTGETVKLLANIKLTGTTVADRLIVDKTIELDMNGKSITFGESVEDGGDNFAVLWVLDEATLTLTGNGTIDGRSAEAYGINVGYTKKADRDESTGHVVINNVTVKGDTSAVQIQCGDVTIEDGYFEANPYEGSYRYTLNCIDASWKAGKAVYNVKGGQFYQFDPSNSDSENPRGNFVADGYTTDENDGIWTVRAKTLTEAVVESEDTQSQKPVVVPVPENNTLGSEGVASTITAKEDTNVTITNTTSATVTGGGSVIASEIAYIPEDAADGTEPSTAYVVTSGETTAAIPAASVTASGTGTSTDAADYIKVSTVLAKAVAEDNVDVSKITSMTLSLSTQADVVLPDNVANASAVSVDDLAIKMEAHPVATVTTTEGGIPTTTTYDVPNSELKADAEFQVELTGLDNDKYYTVYHYASDGTLKGTFANQKPTNGKIVLTLSSFSYLLGIASDGYTPVAFDGVNSAVNSVFNVYMNLQEGLYITYQVYVGDADTTTAVFDGHEISLASVPEYNASSYNNSMKLNVLQNGYYCTRYPGLQYYYFVTSQYPNRMDTNVSLTLKDSDGNTLNLYQNGISVNNIDDAKLYSVEGNVFQTSMNNYLTNVKDNAEPNSDREGLATALLSYYNYSKKIYG